jgi:hypothetical protein
MRSLLSRHSVGRAFKSKQRLIYSRTIAIASLQQSCYSSFGKECKEEMINFLHVHRSMHPARFEYERELCKKDLRECCRLSADDRNNRNWRVDVASHNRYGFIRHSSNIALLQSRAAANSFPLSSQAPSSHTICIYIVYTVYIVYIDLYRNLYLRDARRARLRICDCAP